MAEAVIEGKDLYEEAKNATIEQMTNKEETGKTDAAPSTTGDSDENPDDSDSNFNDKFNNDDSNLFVKEE